MSGDNDRNSMRWLALVMIAIVALMALEFKAEEDAKAIAPSRQRGPDVVLRETPERTIHEYRQNGQLTMIKVVPKKGKPYFLVPVDPTENFGELGRAKQLKPQWVIKRF